MEEPTITITNSTLVSDPCLELVENILSEEAKRKDLSTYLDRKIFGRALMKSLGLTHAYEALCRSRENISLTRTPDGYSVLSVSYHVREKNDELTVRIEKIILSKGKPICIKSYKKSSAVNRIIV